MSVKQIQIEVKFDKNGKVIGISPETDVIQQGDRVQFFPAGQEGNSIGNATVLVNGAEIPLIGVTYSLKISGDRLRPFYENKLIIDTFDIKMRGDRIHYIDSAEGHGEVVDTSVSDFYKKNQLWIDKVQRSDLEYAPTRELVNS